MLGRDRLGTSATAVRYRSRMGFDRRRRGAMVTAAAVASTALAAVTHNPSPAAALPAGFSDTAVAAVTTPTSIEQLPNDVVVVLEQDTGRVRLIDPASRVLSSTPALDLAVCQGSERGLLGFTHDPDFGRTGRVYVFYTRVAPEFPGGCVNRVSAFTMSGATIDPASEQVLIDNISSVNGNHNAGDVEIGNDGRLYVSTGDAGRDPRGDSGSAGSNDAARDLSLLNGKILRLDRFTGAPAPGNPLAGPGTVRCGSRGNTPATPRTQCQEIFAWGLRNPYRFAFDPNTSATRFFVNDVGQAAFEEVNAGRSGADYGWNVREGTCPRGVTVTPCAGPPAGLVDPIVAYGRELGTYVTAGAFVPDGVWPERFDGGYLFADGGSGRIWLRSGTGAVDFSAPVAQVPAGLADMAFVLEPDGYALWYTLNGSSQVRRIAPPRPAVSPASGPQVLQTLDVPVRAFDSRDTDPAAPIRGGTTRLLGLDAPAGATAALVNLAVVRPAGNMYATVWEPRTRRPASSNVNAPDGGVVANSSIVPVDDDGRILVNLRTTADLVVDVLGWFTEAPSATAAGRYVDVRPSRLVDTRAPAAPDNDYTVRVDGTVTDIVNVPVAGRNGVPDSGVSSVAFVVTGVSGSQPGPGHVTVFAGGVSPLQVSHLNVNGRTGGAPDRRANLVIAPLGSDSSVDVRLRTVDDVVLDVVGWFTDGTAASGTSGRFRLLPPTREVDTRVRLGFGPLGPGSAATLDPVSVPASASAIAQNLTMAPSSSAGYVAAYPATGTRPFVSNLNATATGQVRAALAVTPLAAGRERIFSLTGTQLVVDAFGYFE